MTAINANMTNTVDWIPLSAGDAAAFIPGFYTIDSEDIEVGEPHSSYAFVHGNRSLVWDGRMAVRGVGGSTAASHTSGATLTRYYPDAESTGGGGGAISVTDGTTTVNPTTSLSLPSGTLTDSGGGVATVALINTLLGPVSVPFDTPDFVNPADDGPAVLTIPAGSLFHVFAITTEAFDQPGQLVIVAGDASNVNTTVLAGYSGDSLGHPGHVIGEPQFIFSSLPVLSASISRWAIAAVESVVCVGYYPDGSDPTEGSTNIYAIIATPAS